MKQNILFETFDEFVKRRQREKRTEGIREFLNAYKLQKFKNFLYRQDEEMKRLYEGKGFWRIKKDGRQYIKKDGSKGIFQPYKNSIRQKLFASNKVSSETDVASRSRDIKTQRRQDRINHAEAKRLEAEQKKREKDKAEQTTNTEVKSEIPALKFKNRTNKQLDKLLKNNTIDANDVKRIKEGKGLVGSTKITNNVYRYYYVKSDNPYSKRTSNLKVFLDKEGNVLDIGNFDESYRPSNIDRMKK